MAKIYYAGDWAILTGPTFMETPFHFSPKGLEIFNYGKWLKDALESEGAHQVTSVPSWDFYKLGPGEYEKILEDYDVIIFSDIEGKLFQLAPEFFTREEFGRRVLTFPDRIRLTREAVIEGGKSVVFLGGWYSFTGELGRGGWGRTGLKDLMPVECLDIEDLMESTEGFTAEFSPEGKKLLQGLDLDSLPPILGYNKVKEISRDTVLARFRETGDPMLIIGFRGKGKVLAYTSDPAPHWGCNFVFWKDYGKFWNRLMELV
ncbi:MAG: hypothetical protein JW760_05095 [Spirochaetales bacterium]|nr:hypothetical protein [Spirochaetales bacterium]